MLVFQIKSSTSNESNLNYPLTGTIHVDKFMVGGSEENKNGRSKGQKNLSLSL